MLFSGWRVETIVVSCVKASSKGRVVDEVQTIHQIVEVRNHCAHRLTATIKAVFIRLLRSPTKHANDSSLDVTIEAYFHLW